MLDVPATAFAKFRDRLDDRLYILQGLLEAARERRGNLILYTGTERHGGAPLRILYFGTDANRFVASMFFAEHREEWRRNGLSAWAGARELRRAGDDVDFVLGDLSWPYWRRIPAGRFLRVVPSVSHKIPLAADWATMEAAYRKRKTTRDDVNSAQRYGFEFRLTQDRAIIEHFYDHMYVPYATDRHGQNMQVESREALVEIGAHGALMQVLYEGRFIGGGLLYRMADSLRYLWFGILSNLESKLADGLRSAIYFQSIALGISIGCRDLDLMYTPPLLNNGIYRYKRKLGTRLVNDWPFSRIVLRPTNLGPAVVSALTHLPLVVPAPAGAMRGKMLLDREGLTVKDLQRLHADNACPGMDRLQVFSMRPLSADVLAGDYSGQVCPLELFDLSGSPDPAIFTSS